MVNFRCKLTTLLRCVNLVGNAKGVPAMLPLTASPNFVTLAETYRDYSIVFPKLKGVTLAQWALESGWGMTRLAKQYHNYAGMKWGKIDGAFGEPIMYGGQKYTGFTSPTMFIEGY